jgi:hypothetical protein
MNLCIPSHPRKIPSKPAAILLHSLFAGLKPTPQLTQITALGSVGLPQFEQ